MGMFDYYKPVPSIACPVCGKALEDWQGKSAECALVVWRQGVAAPVDQPITEESRTRLELRDTWRLPDEFELYTDCDCSNYINEFNKTQCGVWIDAIGKTIDSVWATTEITHVNINKHNQSATSAGPRQRSGSVKKGPAG